MKLRIVVVEDDPAITDILAILLRRNGFDVEEYLSGAPLMKPDFQPPHLFLIDKQLQEYDGLDICRHLKQRQSTSHVPVVILSATPGLHQLVAEAGADAFIEKPFTSRKLLETIHSLTRAMNEY